jgi:hypothetical protein
VTIIPITLRRAKAFVDAHHRHAGPVAGWRFGVGLVDDAGTVVGVGIAGRPTARMLDNGTTIEVTRVCVTDAPNGCSMIYAALRRAAKALGYCRAVTYTLDYEGGASLRASGWHVAAASSGGEWDRVNRPRGPVRNAGIKTRWETEL